jgi:transcription elongation factor
VNRCIKIRSGPYKGYRGRVKELTGVLVRIELESLMKIVTGKSVASVLFFLNEGVLVPLMFSSNNIFIVRIYS